MSFTLHTYVIPRCTSSMQIDGKLLKLLVMLQMSQHKPSEKFPPKVRLHCAPVNSGDNNAEQDIARKSMQVLVSDGGRIRFPHLPINRNALNALNQYPSMSMRWFTLPAFCSLPLVWKWLINRWTIGCFSFQTPHSFCYLSVPSWRIVFPLHFHFHCGTTCTNVNKLIVVLFLINSIEEE